MSRITKIVVSGLAAIWIFGYVVDWSSMLAVLRRANWGLLVLALSLHVPGYVFSVLRWQTLLKSSGVDVQVTRLIDSQLIAGFYNLILPTRTGGDISRAIDLRGDSGSLTQSASIVVLDRLFGIAALFGIAICAALSRFSYAFELPAIPAALGAGCLGLTAIVAGLYTNAWRWLIERLPIKSLGRWLLPRYILFRKAAASVTRKPAVVAVGLGYSLLIQLSAVMLCWLIGQSLGFNVEFIDYFFLIPLQLIILMLPSVGGLGLRELSSVILFTQYGVSQTEAVAFGLLELLLLVVVAFVGLSRLLIRRSDATAVRSPV